MARLDTRRARLASPDLRAGARGTFRRRPGRGTRTFALLDSDGITVIERTFRFSPSVASETIARCATIWSAATRRRARVDGRLVIRAR